MTVAEVVSTIKTAKSNNSIAMYSEHTNNLFGK